jgi:hypothetical protein
MLERRVFGIGQQHTGGENTQARENFRNAFVDKLNKEVPVVKENLSFCLRVVRFKKVLIHAKTPILGSGTR